MRHRERLLAAALAAPEGTPKRLPPPPPPPPPRATDDSTESHGGSRKPATRSQQPKPVGQGGARSRDQRPTRTAKDSLVATQEEKTRLMPRLDGLIVPGGCRSRMGRHRRRQRRRPFHYTGSTQHRQPANRFRRGTDSDRASHFLVPRVRTTTHDRAFGLHERHRQSGPHWGGPGARDRSQHPKHGVQPTR
jgi:hypothetical protein